MTPQEALQARLSGFPKQAGVLDAFSSMAEPAADTAAWGMKKGMALVLLAPLLFGASLGVLQSKLTSPSTKFRTAQKGLIAGELDESLAEMERRRQAALLKEKLEGANSTERTAHI